jgi:hypothetical protein
MERIKEFKGKYRFLSNFYPLEDKTTVEHYYQACKTYDTFWQEAILSAPTPGDAKKMGRLAPLRADFEDAKIEIMYSLVFAKFDSNPSLKKMLIETGDAFLEEGNNWNDKFWGVDLKTGEGENNLGEILMAVREIIKNREKMN